MGKFGASRSPVSNKRKIFTSQEMLLRGAKDAILQEDVERLEALLERGYHPDMQIDRARRGASFAIQQENEATFDHLVDNGAEMNHEDRLRTSPLYIAVKQDDLRGVRRAIRAGARVEETFDREPPSVKRAQSGAKQIQRKADHLLFHVSDVAEDIVQALLDAGGWKALGNTNKAGETPAEYCEKKSIVGSDGQPDLFGYNSRRVAELMQKYEDVPAAASQPEQATKTALLGVEGAPAALEHPATWERWQEISAALEEKGEPIRLNELRQINQKGVSWLQRSAECWRIKDVIAGLNERKTALGIADLLDDEMQPTSLYGFLKETRQLKHVFTLENVSCMSEHELKALVRPLEREERSKHAPDYHQLQARLSQATMPGRGR